MERTKLKVMPFLENPPQEPESFEQVLADFEEHIMPGVAQWNHPQFHAYFPSGNAYCNVLADALNAAIGAICFSWVKILLIQFKCRPFHLFTVFQYSCPAATELETIVLDWFARALDLPEGFMTDKSNFKGGGCFNGSASECTLVATFAARARAIKYLKGDNKHVHDSVYLPQLVAYASREAHSSVEKASMMALLQLRILEPDEFGRLQAQTVEDAIKADLEKGLTPCLVVATVGTTGMTAFDDLEGIGKAIEKLNLEPQIWFHVDGAYGGNSFILPEMRVFKKGLEYADSFNVNPNKLLLTAFDSSCLWARNVSQLKEGLIINPYYLQAEYDHERQIDYRHYGVSLSRRFRSLKLWFLFRTYGVSGLQKYVRNIMEHAKIFEELVRADSRFEVVNIVTVGLVTFRYREREGRSREEANRLTHLLLGLCNRSSIIHMIPNSFRKKDMIRFSVNYEHSTRADIGKKIFVVIL